MPNETKRQVAIEAKHLRPRLDHASLRPGAADIFASAFERRLTVICAPAGYGKTTTTAAALERCGRSAAWYKLDVLDHDPLAFLAALTRSLQRSFPGFGAALLRELESGPVVDLPVEILAARFCSECDVSVTSEHHLVLDDYHEVMDSQALNDVLGYLIENCPRSIHWAVLTRYEPAFRFEKLRLAGEVTRLSRDLLLFDAEQVAEVLAQRSGREHDPEHVRSLLRITEGWPASVVLAGMALNWLDVSSLEEALADPRLRGDVFSYLAEQVFQRQSEDVRHFLLGTCCLEHITGNLGEALTGSSHASRRLHYLARNHIFTFDTERAGAYRYHNLLRDFLRQRFVQDEGEPAFRDLQRRTAVALEDSGDLPGAVELLLGANELDLALGVIARGGEAELERRPSEQLRIWVARLSPSLQDGAPWALVVSGVLATRESVFPLALEQIRAAVAEFEGHGSRRDLYEALSILEWTEFWSGDPLASMATCNRALDNASTDAQRLHTLLSLLSAALDMRRWSEVDAASQQAGFLLPRASEAEAARAAALRAHAAYYRGDMRGAQELIGRCHKSHQSGAQLAAALNTQGMISLALGQYDQAARCLESATDIAQDFGQVLTSYMIDDNTALLQASAGDFGAAQRLLTGLAGQSDKLDSSIFCFVKTHQGTVLRRGGDIAGAVEPAGVATEILSSERDPYLALNAEVNLAFSEGLLGGERAGALVKLSSAAAAFGVRFVELKALLYAGILEDLAGNELTSVELLEACLPQQIALGHINVVAQELCPRPSAVIPILRRSDSNRLGQPLLSALSHHWRFRETAAKLRNADQPHTITWLDALTSSDARTMATRSEAPTRPHSPERALLSTRGLTPQEARVLRLMAEDLGNAEIAAQLFIAISTVKTHVNHILRKLGQKTRVGAILEYQRLTGTSPPTLRPEIHPGYDSSEFPRQ
jgi:LuxR family maltose regulon positive regulatory protein